MNARCRRQWLGLILLMAGCTSRSHHLWAEPDPEDGGSRELDAANMGGDAGGPVGFDCLADTTNVPDNLECTGLYDDIVNKKVSSAAHAFEPASKLWSDNAEKQRWIALPPGTQIDNSSENDWVFPIGTRVWKEFKLGGKRIETRFFWKVRADKWHRATYAWNASETKADFHFGGEVQTPSGPYYIPKQLDCDECHFGQKDNLLGFEAISLGLPGAKGMTLAQVAEAGWLTEEPERVELSIGDDGTGLSMEALAYLHINCGVSCHNSSPRAKANQTSQSFRLNVDHLDGRAPSEIWNTLRTVVGKPAEGIAWRGTPRIIPGDPDNSLVVRLMGHRDTAGTINSQMPPLATRIVDDAGLAIIRAWITRLKPPLDAGTASDAGAPDAAVGMDAAIDAGVDAGPRDAGTTLDAQMDAGIDAGQPDTGLVDDAGLIDDAGLDGGAADAAQPDADDDASSDDAAEPAPDAEPEADADTETGTPP